MRLLYFTIIFGFLYGAATSLHAAEFDVSRPSMIFDEKSKHLTATTNDVVFIRAESGVVAVVQFTSFGAYTNTGPLTASYRWRCHASASQAVLSGSGLVREDYNKKPSADGKGYDVTPKADHDPMVHAGDIKIEWSYGTESSGYLYYFPSRAKIQILTLDAFNRDL